MTVRATSKKFVQ